MDSLTLKPATRMKALFTGDSSAVPGKFDVTLTALHDWIVAAGGVVGPAVGAASGGGVGVAV